MGDSDFFSTETITGRSVSDFDGSSVSIVNNRKNIWLSGTWAFSRTSSDLSNDIDLEQTLSDNITNNVVANNIPAAPPEMSALESPSSGRSTDNNTSGTGAFSIPKLHHCVNTAQAIHNIINSAAKV